MARRSLSELAFFSLLVYSPRGETEISKSSRQVRDQIKNADPATLATAVTRLRSLLDKGDLSEFLGPEKVLIPAPRSAPVHGGGLWPAERICATLVDAGLGREVLPCLERATAVPKASFAVPGERPTVEQHMQSMRVRAQLVKAESLTIVDDFVTKGRMLFASAGLVQAAYPTAQVRAFALIRTLGMVPEIERILEPCTGRIFARDDDVVREP